MSGGRTDPERETHLFLPGIESTLCGTTIAAEWTPIQTATGVQVSCYECHSKKVWLEQFPTRTEPLPIAGEPWTPGERKRLTGNNDPGRGMYARPASLQLCLVCGRLRGPFGGYDNLCNCDADRWETEPLPRAGDLSNNVELCMSCISTVKASSSRWATYYCDDCLPAVQRLRRRTRGIVPVGYHSIANGISWSSDDGEPITVAESAAFTDQLNALFASQDSLVARTRRRTLARAEALGLHGQAVLAADYFERSRAAGFIAKVGFAELVTDLGIDATPELIDELWDATTTTKETNHDG